MRDWTSEAGNAGVGLFFCDRCRRSRRCLR
jgi:hypothetical protein